MLLPIFHALLVAAAYLTSVVQAVPLSFNTSNIDNAGNSEALFENTGVPSREKSSIVNTNVSNNASAAFDHQDPSWTWPTFKQFPDDRKLEKIKQAYRDSFEIADAALFLPSNSDIFKRYFRPQDSNFVHFVWESLFDLRGVVIPSRLFAKMTIWYGPIPGDLDLCTGKPWTLGYLLQALASPDDPVDMIICVRTMQLPVVRDQDCDKLSDHIDHTFENIAVTLLHEYAHWAALVKKALRLKDPVQTLISDYEGNDPPDGYGPYNVLQVREKYDPTNNAENFAYEALEAFFHRKCRGMSGDQYGPGVKNAPVCIIPDSDDLAPDCHAA